MGGTSYLILENSGNILIDCPAWEEGNRQFLQEKGVHWLFITHRGATAKAKEIQQLLGCEVLVQEQEAYLLPGVPVTSFQQFFRLSTACEALWTPGHSPGSACLYCAPQASEIGGILFSGRHLLPNQQGDPVPLRISKTFHWRRQIESVRRLRDRFSADTLHAICPGANTGFLRGERFINGAYERLMQLDLDACLQTKPIL